MIKSCDICNTEFQTTYSRKVRCSEACVMAGRRLVSNAWSAANPDKVQQSNKLTQRRRIENGKFRQYQTTRRSSKAGYLDRFLERSRMVNPATDLTRAYLDSIFADKCSVTGVQFRFDRVNGTGFQNPFAPSIDRIDSALPYQIGNIQIVLTAVNFAKNEMSMSDFTAVWKQITHSWAALIQ